uniref:F-box domain-containing protein n=1 Tax=Mycena chlorophos TaxID=658473 RepID=A0ABQ0M4J5_MYCCL|nr:predicted protein [Mycena chlorophos]
MSLEALPVELIGRIIGELPSLADVIQSSQLSHRLNLVCSDPVLNVWRQPILRALDTEDDYDPALKNLSVLMSVPRHNWVDILAIARASFVLYDATLPALANAEWEEAFRRRFLPSWANTKSRTWKEAFMSTLHNIWHRSRTPCTVNEAWTKYIVLNRNGSANLLEVSSRNFDPTNIFADMRLQQNTYRLPLRARLIIQFADVRILAFGTLDHPRSGWAVNPNARPFLEPPIIQSPKLYSVLKYPMPTQAYLDYPYHQRSRNEVPTEELGLEWVGGLMIVAQIAGRGTSAVHAQDQDLLVGPNRHQYASFSWDDLWAVAPWLQDTVSRCIDGHGLGI